MTYKHDYPSKTPKFDSKNAANESSSLFIENILDTDEGKYEMEIPAKINMNSQV